MSGQTSQAASPLRVKVPVESGNGNGATKVALRVDRGHCRPFGATPVQGGVNFAVFSRHAQAVHLVLFKEGREEPIAEVPLNPTSNRTGDVWHMFVADVGPEVQYGYRIFGPTA